jgi:hypothetical protein
MRIEVLNFKYVMLEYNFLTNTAKLYLPKVNKSSGAVIDMWIEVKLITFLLCNMYSFSSFAVRKTMPNDSINTTTLG